MDRGQVAEIAGLGDKLAARVKPADNPTFRVGVGSARRDQTANAVLISSRSTQTRHGCAGASSN